MNFADGVGKAKLTKLALSLAAVILLLPITAVYSFGAEQFPTMLEDEAGVWADIAYVRFQAAQGYDLQSDIRRQAAFTPKGPQDLAAPGDELELAGDEKSMACDEYQRAAKQWEKAAQGFKSVDQLDKARTTKDSAAAAWLAARRTVLDAIELYRMAEEFYATANALPKKSAVLEKIAANLERLIEINATISSNSVS